MLKLKNVKYDLAVDNCQNDMIIHKQTTGTDLIEKNLPADVDNTSEKPLNNSFSDVLSTVIMPNRQNGRISDNAGNLL